MSEEGDTVQEDDSEMMNMFASVWVKIEVCEDENEPTESGGPSVVEGNNSNKPPTKKKKQWRSSKLLRCEQCDYTTVYKNCLTVHNMGHADLKPYSCDHCEYATRYPSCLQRHMSMKHRELDVRNDNKQSCDVCDYTTYCKWNLQAHKRKHKADKQYKCVHCNYETAYRNSYVKHSKTHEEKTLYKCDKCHFETIFEGRIKRHLAQMHNEEFKAAHQCDLCGFANKERWKLKKHLMRSKREKYIKCAHCDYKTLYKCAFKKHSLTHLSQSLKDQLDNRRSQVNLINYNRNNTTDVVEEMKSCKQCSYVANTTGAMERHKLEVHKEIPEPILKCEYCDFTTCESFRLKMHLKSSNSDSILKCSYCNLETYHKCEIRKHKYITHYSEIYGNGRNIDCSNLKDQIMAMICFPKDEDIPHDSEINVNRLAEIATDYAIEKSDVTVNPLTNTVDPAEIMKQIVSNSVNHEPATPQTEHEKSNNYLVDQNCAEWHSIQVLESDDRDRPFQCSRCKYVSKFKSAVQRHYQRRHTGQRIRPYKCVNCDFATKTKDQIALHNKRSHVEKEVECESCEFKTNYKCALVYHQRVHFTFKCVVCNYSCRRKYELTNHFATYHLGNGLKCQYCEFTAVRKESILSHETVHTGVKPYMCSACDYSSVRKSLLNKHVKKHHDEEIATVVRIPHEDMQSVETEDTLESNKNEANAINYDYDPL